MSGGAIPFDEAETYRAKGWAGVLALPSREKGPPPSGFTGGDGRWPTPGDWEAWRAKGLQNIALRLPPVVVGLDVDDYGDKPGAAELRRLEATWGELPPTWSSTSRVEGQSGIRLYRIPADPRTWPTDAAPAIEIIRFAHRYVVCWPSVHPEGRTYRWRKPDGTWANEGELPGLSDLPALPEVWLAGLTGVPTPEGRSVSPARSNRRELRREAKEWLRAIPRGEPCRYVGQLAADAQAAARREEGNAYDHTRDAVMSLLRAAETGHPGVGQVLRDVRDIYVGTVSDRTPRAVAEGEFDRFTFDGVERILKEPSERSGRGCDCAGGVTVVTGPWPGAQTNPTSPATKEWPDPPHEAAFYGLLGDVVAAVDPHTEGDPIAVAVNFLSAFGTEVGPGPHFMVGATRHPARTNFVLVGRSGKARKGDSQQPISRIFRALGTGFEFRMVSGLSTGEGLIAAVRDRVEKEESDKKTGEVKTVVVDEGVVDKRLHVVEPELARVLRVLDRQGNTLSAVVRDAWDWGDLSVMTKSRTRATCPHITVVGHVTVEELRRELSTTSAANGLANRFAWIAVKRSKELPRPEAFTGSVVQQLADRVGDALSSAVRVGEMDFAGDAADLWEQAYSELSQDRDGLAGAILNRSEAHVLRLAMLYALTDRSSIVRVPHLAAAMALWDYAERSAYYIFGDASGDPLSDTILAGITAAGQLSRTEISNLLGRHHEKRDIDDALVGLSQRGAVRRWLEAPVGGTGRPVEMWGVQ